MGLRIVRSIAGVMFVFILFTGCALSSIPSKVNLIKATNQEIDNVVGSGTVLLFNDAGFIHKIDITDRVNIWVNGLAIGQLESEEYVIIETNIGNVTFKVVHLDLVIWESRHVINIDKNIRYIRVAPTLTSNLVEVVTTLPEDFKKYTYMK